MTDQYHKFRSNVNEERTELNAYCFVSGETDSRHVAELRKVGFHLVFIETMWNATEE